MQKYLTRVWAVRYFCISPMEAFPKESRGRAESPLVAPAGAKSPAKQEKARKSFSLAFHKEFVFLRTTPLLQRARRFPKGERKALWSPPQRRKLRRNRKSKEGSFLACHKQSVFCDNPLRSKGPEGFQRASGKPFGRLRRGETLCDTGKVRKALSLAFHKKSVSCGTPLRCKGGPKVSKGRAESPLVASAEAKPSVIREKQGRLFPLPSTRNLFLVGGFVRLRADEVLSHTGKYPKGAGGGQRVHVSWPPPDPPLLSYSAPLASQGRAQLGSRPSLGGPLSPSAQLIPPPAPWRRFILGVMARCRHGRPPCSSTRPGIGAMQGACPPRHPIGCWPQAKPNGVPDTDPVGRETRGSAPFGTRGVRGYPSAV